MTEVRHQRPYVCDFIYIKYPEKVNTENKLLLTGSWRWDWKVTSRRGWGGGVGGTGNILKVHYDYS